MSTLTPYDLCMSSTVTFGEWLEERLREAGMTRKELSAAIEMSEAAIYSWMAEPGAQHHRGINARSADRVAAALGIHPNEVRDVAGLPKKRHGMAPPIARTEGLAAARVLLVPVIGVAPANSVRYAASIGEMLPVPAAVVHDLSSPRAVVVGGGSLSSRGIHDGDYLILDSIDGHYPSDGNMIVVRLHDDHRVMEWRRVGERALLLPTDPKQETLEYDGEDDDDLEIIGVVMSVLSVRRMT